MSERYTRIFEGSPDLWTDGAPVIIKAHVLLKDQQTDKTLAQLKFQNAGSKTINYLKIEISPYNAVGDSSGDPVFFEYFDQNAGAYSEFGSKTPVMIPGVSARSYTVKVISAAFNDNSVWKGNSEWVSQSSDSSVLMKIKAGVICNAADKLLTSDASSNTILEAKKKYESIADVIDISEKLKLCEEYYEKAEISRKDKIYATAASLMSNNTIKDIEQAIEEFRTVSDWKDSEHKISLCEKRLTDLKEAEEAKRLEQQRLDEEARIAADNKKKKTKKIVTVVLVLFAVLAVVIAGCFVVNKVIIPNNEYNAAKELFKAGKYDQAISAFNALDGYKDSNKQIELCKTAKKYNSALELYNSGKYEEAIEAFNKLGNYKDSVSKIKQCEDAIMYTKYNAATDLYYAEKYEEAIAAFEALDGYKNSKNLIVKCQTAIKDIKYNEAVLLTEQGKYSESYEILISLDGYKDSAEKAKMIELKAKKEGDLLVFGKYEQDRKATNGKEDIEWIILARENNRVLLITKKIIDCQQYNSIYEASTWENCTLRKWLNNDFINEAFSDEEKAKILYTTVIVDKKSEDDTLQGNDTTDKVFLLSVSEANKYLSQKSRACLASSYVTVEKGLYNLNWWTRTIGDNSFCAVYITEAGNIYQMGKSIDEVYGVRPAMWIVIED